MRAARSIAIGGAVGAVLAATIAFVGLYVYATVTLSRFDYPTIAEASRNAGMVEAAFRDLSAIDQPRCSPAHLAAMRSIVFQNSAVHDAAYRLDDETLCSSGLGIIVAPKLEFGKPDFVGDNGTAIWLHRTISAAPGVKSTILTRGSYSLLIAPARHPSTSSAGAVLSTVLVNRATGATLTFQGPPVPYAATRLQDGAYFHDGARLISVGCVATSILCYVQTITPSVIFRKQAVPYALWVALGLCLGSAGGLAVAVLRARRSLLPNRLRAAMTTTQLSLVYQPTVELPGHRIVGAEALMRWTLPGGGAIVPSEFIPAAEASSLITELDCLAVERVARELGALLRRRPDLVVSINIVARDLTDERFFAALDQHIVGAGIPTRSIAFELTERQAITSDAVLAAARRLHAEGYHLYLDDFGTGYSNIGYLDKLHIDAIKLDKLFTQGVNVDPLRSRLTATILEMGSDLKLPIIVEGVETAAQEAFFRAAGVHLGQGWLYSRALSAAAFIALASEPDGTRPQRQPTVDTA